MIEVKNLKGDVVWTFPKGHLEKGESSRQAALREVKEETGWDCRVIPPEPGAKPVPFERVKYWFKRGKDLVKKDVAWFLMRPLEKTGERDPEEVRRVQWVSVAEAEKRAVYPSDKKLLKKLKLYLKRRSGSPAPSGKKI